MSWGGGGLGMRALSLSPISCIFMQFSAKILPNNRCPLSGKSSIRHCMCTIFCIYCLLLNILDGELINSIDLFETAHKSLRWLRKTQIWITKTICFYIPGVTSPKQLHVKKSVNKNARTIFYLRTWVKLLRTHKLRSSKQTLIFFCTNVEFVCTMGEIFFGRCSVFINFSISKQLRH